MRNECKEGFKEYLDDLRDYLINRQENPMEEQSLPPQLVDYGLCPKCAVQMTGEVTFAVGGLGMDLTAWLAAQLQGGQRLPTVGQDLADRATAAVKGLFDSARKPE